uniref:Trichohyalin-plectin-homology domain-containing protein n=1 Tax=Eutreptiella gymnastica TaxID=73025 RepID=A0A7S1INW7_9EUGL|mmetsp:Transcript_31551/g.56659  ORF Transcript_31551/g.56659 Transcript_31551/m.56659 type:complete len:533 (+) Transcript_31551:158-1756(+)
MRLESLGLSGAISSGGSRAESVVTSQMNRERFRHKMTELLLREYEKVGGPRLGVMGRALVSNEVEMMLSLGRLKKTDLHRAALKIKDAQMSEMGMGPVQGSARGSPLSSRPTTGGSMWSHKMSRPSRAQTPSVYGSAERRADRLSRSLVVQSADREKLEAETEGEGSHEQRRTTPIMTPLSRRRYNERIADREWTEKVEEEIKAYSQDHMEELNKRKARHDRFRHELDDQLLEMEDVRRHKQLVDQSFQELEEQRKEMWAEEKKQEELQRKRNQERERDRLRRQVELAEAEKKRQKDEKMAEEQRYANAVREELQQLKQKKQEQKEQAMKEHRDFMIYNEKVLEDKKQAKLEDQKRDQRYLEEWKAMLDAQEKKYLDDLERKNKKIANRTEGAAKSYFADLWELEKRDAERAAEEARKHEEFQEADERARRQKVLDANTKMVTVLGQQLDEKERKRLEDKAEARRLRQKMDDDVRKAQEERLRERMQDKQEKQHRKVDLDRQVTENTQRVRQPLEIKIGRPQGKTARPAGRK